LHFFPPQTAGTHRTALFWISSAAQSELYFQLLFVNLSFGYMRYTELATHRFLNIQYAILWAVEAPQQKFSSFPVSF